MYGSIILSERIRNFDIISTKLKDYPGFDVFMKVPGTDDFTKDMENVRVFLERDTSGLDYVFLCRTNQYLHRIELHLTPLVESA